MLLRIWEERWRDGGGEDEHPARAPSEAPPNRGSAEDGVRGTRAHALVVSHGAYMRMAVRYFVEELCCPLPPGADKTTMLSLSPNTGLCRFVLTLRKEEDGVKASDICCVFVHRNDHVGSP